MIISIIHDGFQPISSFSVDSIGSNDSGQMGFTKSSTSDSVGEWMQVNQIKGFSATESELILSKINVIAVGRSHSLFASK